MMLDKFLSSIICKFLYDMLKMFFYRSAALTMLLIVLETSVHAQAVTEDSLAHRVSLYNKTQSNAVLYLSTDKTVYLPTEAIWFAGYVLDGVVKEDSLKADILTVALVGEDAAIPLRKNYLVSNNLCAGSLTLPDTIAPGNYQLIACTNIVNGKGEPMQTFSTAITIKSTAERSLTTDFNIRDRAESDSLFIEARAYLSNGAIAAGKQKNTIQYQLLNKEPKTVRLSSSGTVILALPKKEISTANHILHTTTTLGGITKAFNLHLPLQAPDSVRIRFFPEGGDLVTGLPGRVAWEASLYDGRPVATSALLLENNTVLDTLQADSSGMGVFDLQPRNNCIYTLRTISNSAAGTTSQTFALPAALPKGFVLEIANAVVNDTLAVNIKASESGNLSLAITDLLTNASVISEAIPLATSRKLLFPLNAISKGLHALTLLDAQGRPVAERLFFAHFNKKNTVEINTDKAVYAPREQVSTNIMLTDTQGKPVNGLFTVACVQLNRLSTTSKKNIEAYYYIEQQLGTNSYERPIADLYQSRPLIEKLLLVKCWRRYTWQQLMRTDVSSEALLPRKIKLQGRVYAKDGPKVKKPLLIITKHGPAMSLFTTDSAGNFSPKPEDLQTQENNTPIRFKATDNTKNSMFYMVSLPDPMEHMIRPVDYPPAYNYSGLPDKQSSIQQQLRGEPFTHTLQTVNIKARTPDYHAEGYGVNECGDWVCERGFLNCCGHPAWLPGSYPPIVGHTYSENWTCRPGETTRVVYKGCTENKSAGIYTAREFYGMDSLKLATPEEINYLSTLFWKPFIAAADNGRTKVDFYTSDLPGSYKIFVEGLAANGEPVYGEKIFIATEKKN